MTGDITARLGGVSDDDVDGGGGDGDDDDSGGGDDGGNDSTRTVSSCVTSNKNEKKGSGRKEGRKGEGWRWCGGLKGNSVFFFFFFFSPPPHPSLPECRGLKERHLVAPEASADLPSLNSP